MKLILLALTVVCSANSLILTENDQDFDMKSEILEYLENEASKKRDLDLSYAEDPAEYENGPEYDSDDTQHHVNYELITEDEENCDFDIGQCSNSDCLLGFETNDFGCAISCECKKEGLFEGDIRVDQDDVSALCAVYGTCPPGRAASKYLRRWNNLPSANGKYDVPYEFTASIKSNSRAVKAINDAMAEYEKSTCIQFIPRTSQRDYLQFFVGRGCYSYIGRNRGRQVVSIGRGCERKGTVMHELMHAMGFWHEQSRPDRDNYVSILKDNINPRMLTNFRKISSRLVDSMGSPYDADSIMHYNGYSFTRNRKPTIVLKGTMTPTKGQRNGFSVEDLKQLNKMYQCTNY